MKSRTIETREVRFETRQGQLEGRPARSAMCEFWMLINRTLYVYRVEKFRLVMTMMVNECEYAGWVARD